MKLCNVFGHEKVYQNVDIYCGKKRLGEIDVLVVYANHAFVVQAKSKSLCLSSWDGNEAQLKKDFDGFVKSASEQAFDCSDYLLNKNNKLTLSNKSELQISRNFSNVYPLCVNSESFPALSFQVLQKLNANSNDIISKPFIMDLFLFDVIVEMLDTPLYLISYINRRLSYDKSIFSNHEMNVLAYHLKCNLWLDDAYSMMCIGDEVCADLEAFLLARHNGFNAPNKPDGILTTFENTFFSSLISQINNSNDHNYLQLGLTLLKSSSKTIELINKLVEKAVCISLNDYKPHNAVVSLNENLEGIIIHCSNEVEYLPKKSLISHCQNRKYASKFKVFFGVCINSSKQLRFIEVLDYPLSYNYKLKQKVKNNIRNKIKQLNLKTKRNEPCPCHSGLKYKKCCR